MYVEEKIQKSLIWIWLLKIQRVIMVISTVSIIIMFGIVVLARYVFDFNVLGYDEIILVGACWMYFIGSSYAMCEESHIRADIASMLLSPHKNLFLSIFSKVIQVTCGVVLVWLSYDMVKFDLRTNPTTIDWEIPLVISRASILIGFILMTFYSFVYLLRDIHKFRDWDKDTFLERRQ